MAIGQCRSGGITVATVAPAHGADNVIPDNEDSGGPPLPHRGYPMWASKKKMIRILSHNMEVLYDFTNNTQAQVLLSYTSHKG